MKITIDLDDIQSSYGISLGYSIDSELDNYPDEWFDDEGNLIASREEVEDYYNNVDTYRWLRNEFDVPDWIMDSVVEAIIDRVLGEY